MQSESVSSPIGQQSGDRIQCLPHSLSGATLGQGLPDTPPLGVRSGVAVSLRPARRKRFLASLILVLASHILKSNFATFETYHSVLAGTITGSVLDVLLWL